MVLRNCHAPNFSLVFSVARCSSLQASMKSQESYHVSQKLPHTSFLYFLQLLDVPPSRLQENLGELSWFLEITTHQNLLYFFFQLQMILPAGFQSQEAYHDFQKLPHTKVFSTFFSCQLFFPASFKKVRRPIMLLRNIYPPAFILFYLLRPQVFIPHMLQRKV